MTTLDPQRVGHRSPVLGGMHALLTQLAHVLGVLQVGGVRAGDFHCMGQRAWVIQQRT